VWLCLVACGVGLAQTPARGRITLEQFRELNRLMGLQDSDVRAVREQIKLQRAQAPAWWPEDVFADVETRLTGVDVASIAYPAIAPCFTGSDGDMLIALYKTPEGMAYHERLVGIQLVADGQGNTSTAEQQKQMAADRAHLPAAIKALDARNQRLAREFFQTSRSREAFNCMGYGYMENAQVVAIRRMAIAQQVIEAHREELDKAKATYEAQHPDASNQ
jgi:hypothetical protein